MAGELEYGCEDTVQDLSARSIGPRVLAGQGAQVDTMTAAGRLVFGIFAALAEFERELIRRTHRGRSRASAQLTRPVQLSSHAARSLRRIWRGWTVPAALVAATRKDVRPVPVDPVRSACTRAGAFPLQPTGRPSEQVSHSFSAARLPTMIEVHHDTLLFSFHDVHADARFRLSFQRTLRIPDDNRSYPLPPGLGNFPLYRVDDHAARLPPSWREHGGVFLPIAQSEAMWLSFSGSYPMALRIASGKIDAVTGKPWSDGLTEEPQNYVVVPEQPWLDGFCVAKGAIRQFVAMPLGTGYTAEEQLTGEAVHGGLQVGVHPMKRDAYLEYRSSSVFENLGVCYSAPPPPADKSSREMGLAPGGLMKQGARGRSPRLRRVGAPRAGAVLHPQP